MATTFSECANACRSYSDEYGRVCRSLSFTPNVPEMTLNCNLYEGVACSAEEPTTEYFGIEIPSPPPPPTPSMFPLTNFDGTCTSHIESESVMGASILSIGHHGDVLTCYAECHASTACNGLKYTDTLYYEVGDRDSAINCVLYDRSGCVPWDETSAGYAFRRGVDRYYYMVLPPSPPPP